MVHFPREEYKFDQVKYVDLPVQSTVELAKIDQLAGIFVSQKIHLAFCVGLKV